jgi:hypothetical protein
MGLYLTLFGAAITLIGVTTQVRAAGARVMHAEPHSANLHIETSFLQLITLAEWVQFMIYLILQNVTLVYWTLVNISQYGILIVNLIISPTIFFVAIAIQACRSRDASLMLIADSPSQRSLFKRGSLMQLGVIIGVVNILAGFGIVYASQPDRTPPLIQV